MSPTIGAAVDFSIAPVVALADGKYNAWPGLTRAGSGKLYCSLSQATDHDISWDNVGGIVTSTDNGRTWSSFTRLTPTATAGSVRYLAGGVVALTSGRVLFCYEQHTKIGPIGVPYVIYSDDAGGTWSTAIALPTFSHSFDFGGQSLSQLSTGRVLAVGYGTDTGETSTRYKVGVSYSDDNGLTWTGPIVVGPANDVKALNEASIIEKPNGDLVMFIRSEQASPGDIYKATSTDHGATWSAVSTMGFSTQPGMPTGVILPTSQRTLLFHRGPNTGNTGIVKMAESIDYGASWGSPRTMDTLPFEYGGACTIDTATIGVMYAVDNPAGQDIVTPGRCDLRFRILT